MTIVLDASSVLRHLDDEAGAARMDQVFKDCLAGKSRLAISSVQWNELAYLTFNRRGSEHMQITLADLLRVGPGFCSD